MKTLLVILTLACNNQSIVAQDRLEIRYCIGLLPSKAHHIYGLAIGLIGSEVRCDKLYKKTSHGLNIQLFGQGFFAPFYVFKKETNYFDLNQQEIIYDDSVQVLRAKHNGLLFAGFGTFTEQINGLSLSPWMSIHHKVNGVALNALANNCHTVKGLMFGLYNSSHTTNGLQIGLVNKTNHLQGFQFGLWNVNGKRKLPFINWSFK